jgi:integrase
VTWEQVLKELPTAATLRDRTLEMYREAVANLRKTIPTTRGPSDITPEVARRFRHLYATTPFTRSKREGAKQYTRSAVTVKNAVHRLSCLWGHLREMGLAESNPWDRVPRPTTPKEPPAAPTEEDFAKFFAWVDGFNWELMSIFLRIKSLAGCRTFDLCQVKANQFDAKNHTLTIRHEQDKTHRTRLVPLPPDLSVRLNAIRGQTYVWERYAEFAVATGDPRAARKFTPKRLYWAVRRLFVQYAHTFPDRPRITAHDLRRRAITLVVKATGSVDAAADALGVSPATARKHYLDTEKAFDSAELLKKLAAVLVPQTQPQNPAPEPG